ncbi:restriction endonuclease subunit S [Streptococcus mitis]|uniref:restriction endonuclease subunit S n=1 Tax=Streptococcus mitis TaxID=28037 RepID=UPI0039C15647
MTIIFLQNIFEKSINGEWGNEDSGKGEATAVIRTSNFLNSGRLNLDNIVCREIDKDKNSGKILRTGDIIIEKSGGSPNQPVGRVVYFDVTDQDYFTNNFTSILRVKPEYNSKYIFYLMKYLYDTKKVLKFQNQTTGIINLKLADYLNKTKVNIEAIENQNTIVDILDRLEYQIINRNKQLSELSNLVKSRFNEMFEEYPDSVFLDTYIKELRAGKSLAGEENNKNKVLKTGAVSYDYFNSSEVKNLPIDYIPLDEHKVEIGDVIISRMNTSELVGAAGYVWAINNDNIYLPDRLWKVILNDRVNPVFLWKLITNEKTKLKIKRIASGTSGSMKNISKSQFLQIRVPLPPLSLQNEFADFVAQVDKSQFACQIVIKLWRNSLKSSII